MQQAMHAENQQPIPPGAQVRQDPPAEPALGAAPTAQPCALSGGATSPSSTHACVDDARSARRLLVTAPGAGNQGHCRRAQSTSGDAAQDVRRGAELASVGVAAAGLLASAAPVKSLSVDEVTAVFQKLKDRLATGQSSQAQGQA